MKLLIINFRKWGHSAAGGRLRRIYDRVYIKGYIWTPFVILQFKLLPKAEQK